MSSSRFQKPRVHLDCFQCACPLRGKPYDDTGVPTLNFGFKATSAAALRVFFLFCKHHLSVHKHRSRLRKQLRQARRALSPAEQKFAAQLLAQQLRSNVRFMHCKHIAFYLANDGEIDPSFFLRIAERYGKNCYLPRLHRDSSNRMAFLRYRSGDKLHKNRYGIPEPHIQNARLPAWALQLVLLPLVGFDRHGQRLGMGGGFYDRTFAFKRNSPYRKPLLIGLAHGIQEVPSLQVENWDIPLNGIVTEKMRLFF